MATPVGVYPFATQDGKPIPLDIIKGSAVMVLPFTVGGFSASAELPEFAIVGVLMSKKGCLIRFGGANPPTSPSPGEVYPDCIVVPDNGIVTIAMEPSATIVVTGLTEDGTLYIQFIEQWAALGLATQYARK